MRWITAHYFHASNLDPTKETGEREREKGEETHTRDRRKRHLHSHLTAAPRHQRPRTVLMANQTVFQKLKSRWIAETKDEEKVAAHLRLLRAAALFAGSVFLMRSFGDLMAV
jgi:hypothetical protein